MRSLRRYGGVALGLALAGLIGPGGAGGSAGVASPVAGPVTGRLTRAGQWMVDGQGRVVIVHGVNIVRKTAPFYPQNFTAQDARFLANEGFTAARIGFIWEGVEPQAGRYDEAYIKKVVGFNRLLAGYGIRTLVDFHQDAWSRFSGGDGAPRWATLGGNLLDDFQHFWNNDPASDGVGLQTHFVNAWRRAVRRLDASSSATNVLGLDPFNEPYAGTNTGCAPFTPCPAFEAGPLADFYRRVITGVRSTGDRHVIFPEGIAQNGAAQPSLPKFADAQTAFTFHFYCPITQTATSSSPADAGCPPLEQHGVGNFTSYANSLGVPALLGEFSCNDANDDNAAMIDLADQGLLSWTIWMYYDYAHDPANCPAQGLLLNDSRPGSEANAKQAKLDAIVVPYPQAVAGTPKSYAFDRSSNTMTLTYQATAVPGVTLDPTATTQIFVPRRKYPRGYRVQVSGARVVSGSTAPWVELAADPGASVSVTISPATNSSTLLPLDVWRSPGAVCARAGRGVRGRWLGPARLSMPRRQVRRQFARLAQRGRRYVDFFCTGPNGIRVGYASPRLLRTLSAPQRRRWRGRAVLILTASRRYSLRGVKPGWRLDQVRRRLGVSRPYVVGANAWYLVPDGLATGVLKVRHGTVQEIGIADPRLVASRRAAGIFFTSFA